MLTLSLCFIMLVEWVVVLYLADRCRHHVVLDQILTLSTLLSIFIDVDEVYKTQ